MRRRLELVECVVLAVIYIALFALDCIREMISQAALRRADDRARFERARRAARSDQPMRPPG